MVTVNIVIPYRPNAEAISAWGPKEGEPKPKREDTLNRCLFYLRKNSAFKHNFIIAIDSDIDIKNVEKSIVDMSNVQIIQSSYVLPEYMKNQLERVQQKARINHAFIDAHNAISDDDWVCYSFISDLIPCKNWDKFLVEQIQKRNNDERYAYCPMFVEVFPRYGHIIVKGEELTHDKIWNVWRRDICIHALTLPEPKDREYVTEDDFDSFCKIARGNFSGINKHSSPEIVYTEDETIIENISGMRVFSYIACFFIKNKYVKRALFPFPFENGGNNWEMAVDNKLEVQKLVVTNSFVFHPIVTVFQSKENDKNR